MTHFFYNVSKFLSPVDQAYFHSALLRGKSQIPKESERLNKLLIHLIYK